MLGWMILFVLMIVPGAAAAMAGYAVAPLTTLSFVFALLFLFALLTHAFRSRAR
jgi:hypothetical protein